MAQTLTSRGRSWTEDEDDVLLEERGSGTRNTWASRAAARLPGRTIDQCWSREKTMRDRENLGPHEAHKPWTSNTVCEEAHLDQLIEAGGFPQFKVNPDTGLITPELVDAWGYTWNPA